MMSELNLYISKAFQEAKYLHQQGDLALAAKSYKKILDVDPQNHEAIHLLGLTYFQNNSFKEAVELIKHAIKICPTQAIYYSNLGVSLQALNQIEEAISSFDTAIALSPDYAEAYSNRANALTALKQFDLALASCGRAIKLRPDYAKAYLNQGNAFQELKKIEDAIKSYDTAIAINPEFAEAYSNRGNALKDLKQAGAAIASYTRAIEIKPDFPQAYLNLGNVLQEHHQLESAVECYDKAISLKPEFVECLFNRGSALLGLKKFEAAFESFKAAGQIEPKYKYLLGMQIISKMHICDWHDFDDKVRGLEESILNEERSAAPFVAHSLTSSLEVHLRASEVWVKNVYPPNTSLGDIAKYPRKDKLRVGYFSADFREHPVSLLTAGLFECHDKSRFELFAFTFGPDVRDEMNQRLVKSFDHFIDIRSMSDEKAASLARELQIDIAVDLGGHTLDSRTGIFALRAAPIQISYIGYLGTMGASYYDYLVADQTLVPPEARNSYMEKIIYLPSYQVNDSKQFLPGDSKSRDLFNLPTNKFIYCCFNSTYKLTPITFSSWMRILSEVPESVLLLYVEHDAAKNNLILETVKRGIDADRLLFCGKLSRKEYLTRYTCADLFLDTSPYNAGATASDALWAGLPILTCMGQGFASRYAASLLTAIEMPELITRTQAEYESLAIQLGKNPFKLDQLKDKLVRNRLTSDLFNTQFFTIKIEDAYSQIYERYFANLPAENIYVA